MADIKKLVPVILKWEGGWANDPADAGGATMKGVTLAAYAEYRKRMGLPAPGADDLKKITEDEWMDILKSMYWDRWQADKIENQSLANILVDWVWASGVYGIKLPQYILRVKADGIVGPKTLAALNNYPSQRELFYAIKKERIAYIDRICKARPANMRFKQGWLNRLADFKYENR